MRKSPWLRRSQVNWVPSASQMYVIWSVLNQPKLSATISHFIPIIRGHKVRKHLMVTRLTRRHVHSISMPCSTDVNVCHSFAIAISIYIAHAERWCRNSSKAKKPRNCVKLFKYYPENSYFIHFNTLFVAICPMMQTCLQVLLMIYSILYSFDFNRTPISKCFFFR